MSSADEIEFSARVRGRITDGVLIVTIENPPVNATSAEVRRGLEAAMHFAAAQDSVGHVVLTGAGRIFIGGADISEFGKPPADPSLPSVLEAIENSSKPVIAAVNGAALGGGLEVALACHYRIAAPAASVGLPEVKLGIVPGAGGTQRLPRLTGLATALDMIATGRTAKAAEALKAGIVDQVADDPVDAALRKLRSGDAISFRKTGTLAVAGESGDVLDAAAAKVMSRIRGQRRRWKRSGSCAHRPRPISIKH
jgi:3-hydroxyacyl-CoA dehydrogenase